MHENALEIYAFEMKKISQAISKRVRFYFISDSVIFKMLNLLLRLDQDTEYARLRKSRENMRFDLGSFFFAFFLAFSAISCNFFLRVFS